MKLWKSLGFFQQIHPGGKRSLASALLEVLSYLESIGYELKNNDNLKKSVKKNVYLKKAIQEAGKQADEYHSQIRRWA